VSKRRLWIVIVLCMVAAGLPDQVAALAEPIASASFWHDGLGAYRPDEQVGYLITTDAVPLPSLSPDTDDACVWTATFEEEVVCRINQERRSRGISPLKVSPILMAVAEGHSVYMRDHDCFDHQCPGELDPGQRACAAGYTPYCWGGCWIYETIGVGYATPQAVVDDWMSSPGHVEILMDGTLREIGVGHASGGSWGDYWTADYGSQPDVLPVFINFDDSETDSCQVTLTLTNEEVSGCGGIDYADQVMISNDPSFGDAQWQPYSLHNPWTLTPGNGAKTVFVRYRDATNYEVASSDGILLFEPYDLQLDASSLTFLYDIGSGFPGPSAVPVAVENAAGDSPMDWQAECAYEEPWPGCTPTSGTTPADLSVSVSGFQTDLPGAYNATITVTSPQDPSNPEVMTVTILAVEEVYQVMLPFLTKADN
jgi:uncharacterized protein YkwD